MVLGVIVGAVLGYGIALAFLWSMHQVELTLRRDAKHGEPPPPLRGAA
jgi:hypothetical protein